jgi:hypothetical protein
MRVKFKDAITGEWLTDSDAEQFEDLSAEQVRRLGYEVVFASDEEGEDDE